jgi:hypothetical protein
MHYRTLDEITQVAAIQPSLTPGRTIRRQRLHHLADLLSLYTGPIQLFRGIEYFPAADRYAARGDFTPLALAYDDVQFRREGLAGDRLGNAMEFFDLTDRQAHRLFCDCHYAYPVDASAIADRIRAVATRLSLRERWENMRAYFSRT